MRVGRVHHLELGFVFATAAFGRNVERHLVARNHLQMQHRRRVVLGIQPRKGGVGQDRGAQLVFGVQIGAAHAFIDHFLQRPVRIQHAVLPPFDDDGDDAGILTDRPVPLGTHPAVGQDLRDGVLGGRALLFLIRIAQRADIIHRVKIADILQRVGDAFDDVVFRDRDGHDEAFCAGRIAPAFTGKAAMFKRRRD